MLIPGLTIVSCALSFAAKAPPGVISKAEISKAVAFAFTVLVLNIFISADPP